MPYQGTFFRKKAAAKKDSAIWRAKGRKAYVRKFRSKNKGMGYISMHGT